MKRKKMKPRKGWALVDETGLMYQNFRYLIYTDRDNARFSSRDCFLDSKIVSVIVKEAK